jgi:hypothetical protein
MTTPPRPDGHRPHLRRAPERKGFELQPRDIEVLRALYEHRLLTRSLFLPLFPPDPARTPAHLRTLHPKVPGTNLEKRLAQLFHQGYVDRFRTVVGGELVYALGNAGATLLRQRQPKLAITLTDWAKKNRALKLLFVEHTLMVARFRIALTVATRETPSTVIEAFLPEPRAPRLTWTRPGGRALVNPDAFFILRDIALPEGRQRTAFFLEADRSTMATKRLRQKFLDYSALRNDRRHEQAPFSIPSFTVATVCKSHERAAGLLRLAGGADSPLPASHRGMFVFTTEETYEACLRNVLAAVWRSAAEPGHPRSLIASPLARA